MIQQYKAILINNVLAQGVYKQQKLLKGSYMSGGV